MVGRQEKAACNFSYGQPRKGGNTQHNIPPDTVRMVAAPKQQKPSWGLHHPSPISTLYCSPTPCPVQFSLCVIAFSDLANFLWNLLEKQYESCCGHTISPEFPKVFQFHLILDVHEGLLKRLIVAKPLNTHSTQCPH